MVRFPFEPCALRSAFRQLIHTSGATLSCQLFSSLDFFSLFLTLCESFIPGSEGKLETIYSDVRSRDRFKINLDA
jgi:hypothetical protein